MNDVVLPQVLFIADTCSSPKDDCDRRANIESMLPTEMLEEITGHLEINDVACFRLTSRTLSSACIRR